VVRNSEGASLKHHICYTHSLVQTVWLFLIGGSNLLVKFHSSVWNPRDPNIRFFLDLVEENEGRGMLVAEGPSFTLIPNFPRDE
jgi:hypothetical protein